VYLLQSAGLGLTTALEGASKSLWLTMESRRSVMEEEQNGPKEGEKKEEGAKEESS
jgi:large subunit ribosomal protein L10